MGLDTAPAPASRRMRLPAPPPGAGTESWVLGGLICLYCWLLAPATSDLAAAVFRSDLLSRSGALLYNAQWYSGHHLPGYSLLSPLLGALLGTRLFAALCTFGTIVAFERIAVPRYGVAGRIGAVLFAITAGSSLLIGRVAFAAGLFLGTLAILLAIRGRWKLAALAAAGCALGSPLAGLFLAMLAGTWFLVERRAWGAGLAVAAVIPALTLSPDTGWAGRPQILPARYRFRPDDAVTQAAVEATPARSGDSQGTGRRSDRPSRGAPAEQPGPGGTPSSAAATARVAATATRAPRR